MAELADGITFHLVNTLGWPSLRPLQREAVAPVRSGEHALLIAPTAGGKTEAAMLPLLSEMVEESWLGDVEAGERRRSLTDRIHAASGDGERFSHQ